MLKFSSAATRSSKLMWPRYTCKQMVHLLLLEEAAQWLDALSSSVAAGLQELCLRQSRRISAA